MSYFSIGSTYLVARRGEAALIANQSGVATVLGLDDLGKVVVDLAAHLHGLRERLGAFRYGS